MNTFGRSILGVLVTLGGLLYSAACRLHFFVEKTTKMLILMTFCPLNVQIVNLTSSRSTSFCHSQTLNMRLLARALQFLLVLSLSSALEDGRVHFVLTRRGGRLATAQAANLTHLAKLADDVEKRYAQTTLQIEGNKVTRAWPAGADARTRDEDLLQKPGLDGSW